MTNQFGPVIDTCFVDKRRGGAGQTNTSPLGTPANYITESALDTRLTTIGYTAKQLAMMTTNDKQYALRLNDDAAGI